MDGAPASALTTRNTRGSDADAAYTLGSVAPNTSTTGEQPRPEVKTVNMSGKRVVDVGDPGIARRRGGGR